VAGDCLSAQSALTNLNNNGAYDGLRQQLIAAGAPYSNTLLGKVMTQAAQSKADLIYPKSLEDFTNNATANGTKIQTAPCAVPLTSATPCGFTVGAWTHTPPSGTTYGAVTDASGKVLFEGYNLWSFGNVSSEGANLVTLLANYNAKTAGDTSGTLGQWMASVGFIDNTDPSNGPLGNPRLKIVLTGEDHKNIDGQDVVCMIDTNINRSSSGQPWCSSMKGATDNVDSLLQPNGPSRSCGRGCLETNYEAASFTASSAKPNFYSANTTVTAALDVEYKWHTSPGWLKSAQGNAAFNQFHWPSLEIQKLPSGWCTTSNRGSAPKDAKNPGGVLTLCGPDLDAWLELELPKPPVSSSLASADATLYRADRNRNDGAGTELTISAAGTRASQNAVSGHGGRGANRLAVGFDAEEVQGILDQGAIGSVRLVLTPAAQDARRHRHGPRLAAYPVTDAFLEGNGNVAAGEAGTGRGATWNCAVDAEVGDDLTDCLVEWTSLRRFSGPPEERPALSVQENSGPLVFDVGDHVASGITAWLIEPFDRRALRGGLGYVSGEGTDALDDLALAPTLILTGDVAEDQALAAGAAE
jgi:hypothetical protein